MARSLYGSTLTKSTLIPVARTDGTVNGTGVDRAQSGGFRSALVIIHSGAITDGTHTFEVQDSDDNSTFAAVADAYLQGTEPALGSTDDNLIKEVGYIGPKRYVRVSVTSAGCTTGGVFASSVVLGGAQHQPVARS